MNKNNKKNYRMLIAGEMEHITGDEYIMSIKGFLYGIDSDKIPFSISENKVDIITEFDIGSIFGVEKEKLKKVMGVTSDNRDIIFLDAFYNKINFSPTGWIISKNNLAETNIETFDGVSFTGMPIDVFYSPKKAIEYEEYTEEMIGKRMFNLMCKPFDAFTKKHTLFIDNEEIDLVLSIRIDYNMQRNMRNIGEVTSSLMLQFRETKPIEQISKYYLYVLDFFRFVNFRKNIQFDKIITLHKKENNLYEKIGIAYFNTHDYEQQYVSTDFNSIIYDDIESNFDNIFNNISSRRISGIINEAYIPDTDSDFRTVDPIKFLSCALTFEGEYKRYISNEKQTLQDRFNSVLILYDNIINQYVKKTLVSENSGLDIDSNLGIIFAKMRNSIGHGDPIPLERKHVAVYRITQCLIYIIMLEKSGVSHIDIKRLIEKLF